MFLPNLYIIFKRQIKCTAHNLDIMILNYLINLEMLQIYHFRYIFDTDLL